MIPEQISAAYDSSIVVRRWAGTMVDLIVLGVTLLAIAAATGFRIPAAIQWIYGLGLVLYYPLLEGLVGQTVGKRVCRLKVVDADGNTCGIAKATIRTILRLVEINPILVGGLPAGIAVLASRSRQRLGDMAANTYVLKVEDLHRIGRPEYSPTGFPTDFTGYGTATPPVPPPGYGQLPNQPAGFAPTAASPYPIRRPPFRAPWALPVALGLTAVAAIAIISGIRGSQNASRTATPVTMT